MSGRYFLRQSPTKTELFEGMVQTPGRRSTRRKSAVQMDVSDLDADSSPAAKTTGSMRTRSMRQRRTSKFLEHLEQDGFEPAAELVSPSDKKDRSENTSHKTGFSDDKVPIKRGNGHASHHTNHADVKAAGKAPGVADGMAHGNLSHSSTKSGRDPIPAPLTDPKIDTSGHFEFGGSWGSGAMMTGFPILMYYMWIGAFFYDGQLPSRAPGQTWAQFGAHLVNLVYTEAFPHAKAWIMYWAFFVFEGAMYCLMPGVTSYGKPLPHLGGKQLQYHCSAYTSFYTTLAAFGLLHATGWFPLWTIIDEFGPLMTVAMISGFVVSIVAYVSAHTRGATHRMTGYHVYDFFMGAELNPRMFGVLDFKMFFEVRLPWFILVALTAGAAARQYDQYGYVSSELCFLCMAHLLYANACAKGEELIVTTWDMYFEKWGFMLIFWNLAGVPFSYAHCTAYLANHPPSHYSHHPAVMAAMFVSYLLVYWAWDTCGSQKNRFRAQERGTLVIRNTFPELPWATLHDPPAIETRTGDKILVGGWYKYARKIHYTCDAWFAISWALVCGFESPFPWFYPVFFVLMIVHRTIRDIQKCRAKYGEAWAEYERRVPHLFIPYVV